MLSRAFLAVVREPLTWFALIALALLAFADGPDESARLTATQTDVDRLFADWQARTGRTPDSLQRRALVDDYEAEAVWAHYARELGLDRGDRIVRARLRRKAETLAAAEATPVTEAEARAEYARRANARGPSARYTFTQHPASQRTSTLPTTLTAVTYGEVVALFGSDFAAALSELTPASTSETLRSPFGEHVVELVSVDDASSTVGSFEQSRARIVAELTQRRREEAVAARLARLRERYGLSDRDAESASGRVSAER